MNLDQPAASERTDVGPTALIQSQIPGSDALRPVGQNAAERRAPRSLSDAMRIFERLNFAGVRVITVSQGIDSQTNRPMSW